MGRHAGENLVHEVGAGGRGCRRNGRGRLDLAGSLSYAGGEQVVAQPFFLYLFFFFTVRPASFFGFPSHFSIDTRFANSNNGTSAYLELLCGRRLASYLDDVARTCSAPSSNTHQPVAEFARRISPLPGR